MILCHLLLVLVYWTMMAFVAALAPATTNSHHHHHHHQRTFQFVEYGQNAPLMDIPTTIACDGRVPGATLEVSHWNGNDTPQEIYADTSTEMAIRFLMLQNADLCQQQYHTATVFNNHYDTDGVCSVYALVGDPDVVLQHQDLLIQAAESGDFEEWNSDVGLKLDLTLCNMCDGDDDDEAGYERALPEMPRLLQDFRDNEGAAYQDLWKDDFEHACQDLESIRSGRVRLERSSACPEMVIVHEATPASRVSPYALSKALQERGLWDGTTRILRVNCNGNNFKYFYEKIGHGWVNKLVQRPVVPLVDAEALVENIHKDTKEKWTKGGPGILLPFVKLKNILKNIPSKWPSSWHCWTKDAPLITIPTWTGMMLHRQIPVNKNHQYGNVSPGRLVAAVQHLGNIETFFFLQGGVVGEVARRILPR
jgi:hypothetical protein